MKFNVCLGNTVRSHDDWGINHGIALTAEDLIQVLRLGLESCGHSVMVSRTYLVRDGINLFIGGFHNENRPMAKKLKEAGYRFGVVMPEWLKDGRYNPFEQTEANARDLYDQFCEGASHAEFIWYMVEESAETCRESNRNAHFLTIGHVPGYANLTSPEARQYEWDFAFAGYSSDHRQSILSALQSKGFTVAACVLEPDYIRRTLLERSRVSLSIQKSAQHSFVSLTRVPHAIMNRVPIIVEYGGPPHYLSPYCTLAEPRDFIDACVAMVRDEDLSVRATDALNRYAAELPMQRILHDLVETTFQHMGTA